MKPCNGLQPAGWTSQGLTSCAWLHRMLALLINGNRWGAAHLKACDVSFVHPLSLLIGQRLHEGDSLGRQHCEDNSFTACHLAACTAHSCDQSPNSSDVCTQVNQGAALPESIKLIVHPALDLVICEDKSTKPTMLQMLGLHSQLLGRPAIH